MNTDFTIMSRVRNSEQVEKLVAGIEAAGHSCYNFLHKPVSEECAHLPWDEQIEILESHPDFWNDPVHRHHFESDLDGLKNADAAILLLPAGIAAHIEAGVAFGMGKKTILIGQVAKPETLYLMFSERYDTIEDFLATLEQKAQ